MTVKELKAELDKLPETLPVSIFDVRMNVHHASDEPTGEGIYDDFQIYELDAVDNDGKPCKIAVLQFNNEDYDDEGEKLY